jgi:hypothetical protein
MESIDGLNVLDVRGGIPGVAEMFHVISEVSLMVLFDSLQGFSSCRMLICALQVVAPRFRVKTECIPLCVPGSIFTHKATTSEINNITNVYYNVS